MSAAELFGTRPAPRTTTKDAYRSAVESVVARMRASAAAPLNLAEMAATAGVSRCHFDRLFRAVTSLSPRRFQTALRLHAATRLLLTSDRSVTDICYDIGYESLGSFVSKFSATFGVPPQRLRQLATVLDQPVASILRNSAPPPNARIRGTVQTTDGGSGILFIGLFRERIPAEAPSACAILSRPGPFAMESPGDGRYFALALDVRPTQRAIDMVLDDALPRGAAAHPVIVRRGTAPDFLVTIRAAEAIDPPVNLLLPLLLLRLREAA